MNAFAPKLSPMRIPGLSRDPYDTVDNRMEIAPAEEPGGGILQGIVGGAQWAGEALSKGGAAVRGVMSGLSGGDWGGGLYNLIPFSDTMGLTDPNKRIDMDKLFDRWGWKAVTGNSVGDWAEWGLRGAASIAGDIATDPATWVGPGLFGLTAKGVKAANATKGLLSKPATGKAAAKLVGKATDMLEAGKLAETTIGNPVTWAEQIRRGERTLLNLKPAKLIGGGNYGTNLMPAEWAAKMVETINQSRLSPLRFWRGSFSKSAASHETTFNEATQLANDLLYAKRALTQSEVDNMDAALGYLNRFIEKDFEPMMAAARQAGDETELPSFLRSLMESYGRRDPTTGDFAGTVEQFRDDVSSLFRVQPESTVEYVKQSNQLADLMHEHVRAMWRMKETAYNRYKAEGGIIGDLSQSEMYAAHAYRKSTINKRLNPTKQRVEDITNIPGDTHTINAAAMDPEFQGMVRVPSDKTLRKAVMSDPELSNPEIRAAMHKALREDAWEGAAMSEKQQVDALRTILGPKAGRHTNLEELRRIYAREQIILPALRKEWPDMRDVPDDLFQQILGNEPTLTLALEDPAKGIYRVADLDGNIILDEAGLPKYGMVRKTGAGIADNPTGLHTYKSELARWTADIKENGRYNDAMGRFIDVIDGYRNPSAPQELWKHGIFANGVMEDTLSYTRHLMQGVATLQSGKQFLRQRGVVELAQTAEQMQKVGDWPKLLDSWSRAKLGESALHDWIQKSYPKEIESLVAKHGIKEIEAAKMLAGTLRINPRAANSMKAYASLANPAERGDWLKFYDHLNSLYKSALYNWWPASHLRDIPSDVFRVMQTGHVGVVEFGKSLRRSAKFLKDGAKSGKGYFDEFLRTLHDEIPGVQLEIGDVAQRLRSTPTGGFFKYTHGEPLKALKANPGVMLNPLRTPGLSNLKGITDGRYHIAQEIGARVRNWSEFVIRGAYYNALREKGRSPAKAMAMVDDALFDYSKTSHFQKTVMKRLFPWWGWQSRNIPFQLKQMFSNPGGLGGRTLAEYAELSRGDSDVYTPSFLQENQAIPIGNNPAQQKFFLNSVLPFNDLNSLVFERGKALPKMSRSAEKFASGIHPVLLSGPELYAGKQMATGRKLSELDSITGNPAVDSFLHYSPVSRVASTMASVTDPRKTIGQRALSQLGLGRVAAYDTETWKLRDLRAAYERLMQENPNVQPWTDYYIPKAKEAEIAPEEIDKQKKMAKRRSQITKKLKALRAAKQRSGQ